MGWNCGNSIRANGSLSPSNTSPAWYPPSHTSHSVTKPSFEYPMYFTVFAIAILSLFGSCRAAMISCNNNGSQADNNALHYYTWNGGYPTLCTSQWINGSCETVTQSKPEIVTFSAFDFGTSYPNLDSKCDIIQNSSWYKVQEKLYYNRSDGHSGSCQQGVGTFGNGVADPLTAPSKCNDCYENANCS